MIYRKLPVVLLSVLASQPEGSTNAIIADYLLSHRVEAAAMGVRDLAQACNVGTGSISRFCREVGFTDLADLRNALRDDTDSFERIDEPDAPTQWARHAAEHLVQAALSVSQEGLSQLATEIEHTEHVCAFGMLKAEAAAIGLQVDLLLLGKQIHTCVPYADQLAHLLTAPAGTVAVIFSYTGDYFSYRSFSKEEERLLRQLKLWMVCPRRVKVPDFVGNLLTFESDGSQLGHPYQLQAIASLLAQRYAAQVS